MNSMQKYKIIIDGDNFHLEQEVEEWQKERVISFLNSVSEYEKRNQKEKKE